MKRLIPLVFAVGVFGGMQNVSAQAWMPQNLDISAPDEIYYRPGDSIPVILSSDAVVFFAVFTKDHASTIKNVRTNHLSWRAVNKIDTCLYISPPHYLTEGAHIIEWNPTESGGITPYGDYYYYLWAVDVASPKQLVSRDIPFPPGGGIMQTEDYEGNPLAQPIFYPSTDIQAVGEDSVTVTRSRWVIGSDPLDASLIEETRYRGAPNWAECGPLAFSPYAPDDFYVTGYNLLENRGSMRRYRWLDGSMAKWDTSWGEDGEVRFPSGYPDILQRDPGAVYINDDLLASSAYHGIGDSLFSTQPLIDAVDGYIVNTIESRPWWQPEPYSAESEPWAESMKFDEVHGMPSLIMGNHLDALFYMLNPQDPDIDWLRYAMELPPPEQTTSGIPAIDRDGFALLPGMGTDGASAGLLTPDGTLAGLLSFAAGEGPRYSMIPVHYGSTYDGIYFDAQDGDGLWYRGYDACRGVIAMQGNYPPVRVVSPNGGETIPAGSICTILADNFSWGSVMLYLKYSLDNGLSWTEIDSMFTSDISISYDWTVPSVNSDLCKIRIVRPVRTGFDYARDESDAVFSISGAVNADESAPLSFSVLPRVTESFQSLDHHRVYPAGGVPGDRDHLQRSRTTGGTHH